MRHPPARGAVKKAFSASKLAVNLTRASGLPRRNEQVVGQKAIGTKKQ
jgi:hypothetical protein